MDHDDSTEIVHEAIHDSAEEIYGFRGIPGPMVEINTEESRTYDESPTEELKTPGPPSVAQNLDPKSRDIAL
jgi:hypothetical protein